MSYLTGGLAYGEVKINGTNNVNGTVSCCGGGLLLSATQTFGHSQVNTGWVVGYGTEGRLGITNWSWKIEGLWMDLGTLDAPSVTSGVSCTPIGSIPCEHLTGGQVTTHSHFTD